MTETGIEKDLRRGGVVRIIFHKIKKIFVPCNYKIIQFEQEKPVRKRSGGHFRRIPGTYPANKPPMGEPSPGHTYI